MKLSDIKGERTFDVIADVIAPITNIAVDKEAAALLGKKKVPDGMEPRVFLAERIKKSLPVLLKDHKRDVISIMAAIEGVSEREYAQSLTLVKLTKDCIELMTDEAFVQLFTSAQSEDSSGSAPENITELKA